MISHAELVAEAERRGMALRSLADVQADLADAKRRAVGKNKDMDKDLARLMLKFGRLSPDAREWIAREYPQ